MTESTPIGVGIDTARYGHHVSMMDSEKRTAGKPFHFTEDARGYQTLKARLEKLRTKFPAAHFHIRIDAAGQYADNLLSWLHQLELPTTISVGQPARNAAYRKVHYDKRKADPVESLACARFAVVERPQATPFNPPEFSRLRDTVALMESSAKQRTRLVNQLHALLAKAFPELAVHVTNLSAKWVLTLLKKYPTAEKLAAARRKSLDKIPGIQSEMADKLHTAAKRSTASSCGMIAERLVTQKVQAIQHEKQEFSELEQLAKSAFEALPEGSHQRILTIKGIGIQTAAALVSKIVSIERFATANHLIGYFGVFPEEVDVSGTDKHGNPKTGAIVRMSRKGNDLVRRLLYLAAQAAVRSNPAIKALFARQRAAGKEYKVAIGHCMAKLLRQVFGLWKKNVDFDPNFEAVANDVPGMPTDNTNPNAAHATQVEVDEKTACPEGAPTEKADGHEKRSRAAKRSSRKRKAVTATPTSLAGDG